MAIEKPRFVYDAGAGNVIIDFETGLADTPKPASRHRSDEQISGSGIRQLNHHFKETRYRLEFEFISEATVDLVQTMIDDWVGLGNSFDFYEDQTVTTSFVTLEWLDGTFRPRLMSKAADIWAFDMKCRLKIT